MHKKKKKNVKKFRKKFNTRIIRKKQTYSTEEVALLLKVHQNTVHVWYKAGLRKIDLHKPHLVFGQDLIEFLNARNKDKKHPCELNELFCCKCQKPKKTQDNKVYIKVTKARTNIMGWCEECGTKINKAISPHKIDFFKKIFTAQVVHEENLIGCTNTCAITKKNKGGKNG